LYSWTRWQSGRKRSARDLLDRDSRETTYGLSTAVSSLARARGSVRISCLHISLASLGRSIRLNAIMVGGRPANLLEVRYALDITMSGSVKSWRLYSVVSLNGDVICHLLRDHYRASATFHNKPSRRSTLALSPNSCTQSKLLHQVQTCALSPNFCTQSKVVH
jgi:hypothetical protein